MNQKNSIGYVSISMQQIGNFVLRVIKEIVTSHFGCNCGKEKTTTTVMIEGVLLFFYDGV
jgi:hypothetical protein